MSKGPMSTALDTPFRLPCGAVLKNRIGKAPMTEGLADPMNRATERHVRLYRRWAEGGAGLLVTGNVQVDRRYLERPGNVVVDGNGGERVQAARRQPADDLLAKQSILRKWARVPGDGTSGGELLFAFARYRFLSGKNNPAQRPASRPIVAISMQIRHTSHAHAWWLSGA